MVNTTLFTNNKQTPGGFMKSIIRKHCTDKHSRGFNSRSHLKGMIFCQFAKCSSLREIATDCARTGADNTVAKNISVETNSILVADRIYSDYALLNNWDSKGVFFS
jgi:hypothetical protein